MTAPSRVTPRPAPAAAPTDTPKPAPPAVQRARALVLAVLLALLLLALAWELLLAPTGRGSWALKVLPLLPCLPGLLRHRLRTYRALSLLVWLYVTEGLVRATSEHGRSQALATAEIVLALLLFTLCVHYIRLRLPRQPRQPGRDRNAASAASAGSAGTAGSTVSAASPASPASTAPSPSSRPEP